MNRLSKERKKLALDLLMESASIRGVQRLTGIHQVTTIRLIREVGANCKRELDRRMRNLTIERAQVDEVWSFIFKKDKRLTEAEMNTEKGSVFVFVALDADTKLAPCHLAGKRTQENANRFMEDFASRLSNRPQLTTDAFGAYPQAVDRGFGHQVDYAQLIKVFRGNGDNTREGYSPSQFVRIEQSPIYGNPDPAHISTSFIERSNLSLRMASRRFARLTNAHSKKLDCLEASLNIWFWFYNFRRNHMSLRMTPGMAAGITSGFLEWDEVLT